MAKVSMHLGFTFRVGELSTNQYGRIDLSIDQIDTELPVDEQLTDAVYTADAVWDVIQTKIDAQLESVLENNE